MISINYEITLEDILQFNLYVQKQSPSQQRFISFIQYFFPIIIIFLSFYLIYMVGLQLQSILYIIFSILWFVFIPKLIRITTKYQAKRLLGEGKNSAMLGNFILTLSENSIHYRSDSGESTTHWNGINKISESNQYIYIFLSSISAYIIPKKAFAKDEELNNFLDFAKNCFHQSNPDLKS